MIQRVVIACMIMMGFTTQLAVAFQLPDNAISEIKSNKARAITQNTAEAYFELAMSYAYNGLAEQGLECLKRVDKLDPNYADIVIQTYESRIASGATDWKNYFKLAFGYYFKKNTPKASQFMKKIVDDHPKNIWAIGYLALIKGEAAIKEKDKITSARETLANTNTNPDAKQTNYLNARERAVQAQFDEVIRLCKDALAIDPDAAAIHFLLAAAYFQKKDIVNTVGEGVNSARLKGDVDRYVKEKGLDLQ